jgi:hypothetical protein
VLITVLVDSLECAEDNLDQVFALGKSDNVHLFAQITYFNAQLSSVHMDIKWKLAMFNLEFNVQHANAILLQAHVIM